MKPVTDPELLQQLDATPTRREVSDPALLRQLDAPEQQAPQRGFMEQSARNLVGGAEAATQFATGAVAAPLAGLAGVGQMVNRRLKLSDMHPGDAVRDVASRLTYSPRTQEGEQYSSIINYPFEKLAEGAEHVGGAVTDKTNSPFLGAQAATALSAIPLLFGRGGRGAIKERLAKSEGEAAAKNIRSAEHNETLNRAGQEGFVVPRLGDKSLGVKADASAKNLEAVYNIGRREAKLAADEPINLKSLEEARERIAAPYREVAAVSPDAASALEILKEVRQQANDTWASHLRKPDYKVRKEAEKLSAEATQWEQFIDAEAVKAGKPDLVARLREARKDIAKNYDVEKAFNVGDGTLDARIWGRMLDKKRTLSGGLETAARFAEAHGDLVSPTNAAKAGPGLTKADKIWSSLTAMGGAAAFGPAGLAAGLLPVANHLTRPFMLGKAAGKTAQPSTTLRGLNAVTELPAELLPAESGNVRLRDLRPQ